MAIIGAKLDKTAVNQAAAGKVEQQRGEAIAATLFAHVKDEAGKLKRFLVDISKLTPEGRKAFRVSVTRILRDAQRHVNQSKGNPENDMEKATLRSAGVRLSEAVTFSKAIDAGFAPAFDDMSYHVCIGTARTLLRSEGTASARGRKPTPILDKVKAFLDKQGLSVAQLEQVETMVHTLVALKKAPKKEAANILKDVAPAVVHAVTPAAKVVPLRKPVAPANDAQERAAAALL